MNIVINGLNAFYIVGAIMALVFTIIFRSELRGK